MAADTILHRLHANADKIGNAPAYYEKQGSQWVATSWKEYCEQVRTAARALVALGAEPGGITTILGFNSPEWVITDVAAMLMGGCRGWHLYYEFTCGGEIYCRTRRFTRDPARR